ncbi:MAG TPA: HAD family phosphatase [Ohtaekwangia sp.]|nr:HAD family phosphatase [Ohtaekwangia sp.]
MKFAFLFDMDGVIVDSNPYHKIALKQFCQEHGHALTEDELRDKIYGRTNKDWIPALFGAVEPEQVRLYADQKEALFRDLYKKDVKPLKGLINFLDQAVKLNVPRAIATSAPRANVDFTLAGTGISKYFETILDDSFVTKGKPDPEIYLKTAAALNFDPGHCIVFEDSLSGVQAGKRAGCKVVGLSTTHTAEELGDTDLVIGDFDEITVSALLKRF